MKIQITTTRLPKKYPYGNIYDTDELDDDKTRALNALVSQDEAVIYKEDIIKEAYEKEADELIEIIDTAKESIYKDSSITVITALTNNMDKLRDDFPEDDDSVKYVAFLDEDSKKNNKSKLWEIRNCCNKLEDSRRNAKIHKIIPHKFVDTDISIWLDANISLNVSPRELVDLWLNDKDISVCKHFERNCLYEEAEVCKQGKLDDPKLIDEQMARYKEDGYPENNGLAECGIIIRRHTPDINEKSEKWWKEIMKGSSRDQLSFTYCFDEYEKVDANARYSPLFNYENHNSSSGGEYAKYYEKPKELLKKFDDNVKNLDKKPKVKKAKKAKKK